MKTAGIAILVALLPLSARAENDGSALYAVGTATTAFAGVEVVLGSALFIDGIGNHPDCHSDFCVGRNLDTGAIIALASVATALVGIPMMAAGIKRKNRARVSLAASPQGGVLQMTGSF